MLTPTNRLKESFAEDGFNEVLTLHKFLKKADHWIKSDKGISGFLHGKRKLGKKSVIFVDEAAMVDNNIMMPILQVAKKAKANLVLIGDHKQFEAIEDANEYIDGESKPKKRGHY